TDMSPFWGDLATFCARYLLFVFAGLALYGHLTSSHPQAFVLMVGSLVLGYAVALTLAFIVRRKRPYEFLGDMKHMHLPIYTPSFPSGHATIAFAIAGSFVGSYSGAILPIVMIIASIIALSRVIVGVHYVSDILAGAVIGLAANWVIGTFLI
ncbi:MAG: phosphatase PAP2 family protein, partial [Sedimentisphaerales bacterium]|nr:phosphatase PAP2 family protein [Sedimentisphaerales bacterium]